MNTNHYQELHYSVYMEIGTLRAFKKKKGLEVELWSRESFVSIGGVHGDRERERELWRVERG